MGEIEKLGVDTQHDGGPCPACGRTPYQDEAGQWRCPKCGTAPFTIESAPVPGTVRDAHEKSK